MAEIRKTPLVSIGLPTYNGTATIERALGALVPQDYPHIELIIANDASTDGTTEACRRYAESHPFVQFSENPSNLGSYGNCVNANQKNEARAFHIRPLPQSHA